MFCKNCGNQIPENGAFCTQCGTPVAQEPVQAPVEQAVQPPVMEEPVAPVPQEVFAQPQFEAPAKPAKKLSKKKLLTILAPVAAVAVVVALVIGFFGDSLKGTFTKTFGSDEDYLSYVEKNSTEMATDVLSDTYGSLMELLSGKREANDGYEMNLKLTVGDQVITMLEDLAKSETGEKIDMSWMNSVDLGMQVNAKDSLSQLVMALNLNEKEIAKLDYIMDLEKGDIFLAIPTLSDKYLGISFDDMLGAGAMGDMDEMAELLEMFSGEELQKALPSEDVLNKLLDKYVGIALDNLTNVKKSTKSVKISGVEQKLTLLETTIGEEDLHRVVTAILKSAKDDKQIKNIINDVAGWMDKNGMLGAMDADEVYKTFQEGVEMALEELEDVEFGSDAEIVVTSYVNNAHEVVGRRIEVEDQEILYYCEVKKGDKIAFELESEGLEIYGEGTEKKGVVNATYTVVAGNKEVCELTFVDFKAEDDLINGKLRIAPSSDLMKELGLGSMDASALALADPQLELAFASTKSTASFGVNLLSGENLLVGITLSSKEVKAAAITLPKDAYDIDEAQEWLKDMDPQKLLDKLEEAGLPISEIMGEITLPAIGKNEAVLAPGGFI